MSEKIEPLKKPHLPKEEADKINAMWSKKDTLSPETRQDLDDYLQYLGTQYDPPSGGGEVLDHVVNGALSAVDYGSGLMRTAALGGASAAKALAEGKPNPVTKQDLLDAVNPFDGKPAVGAQEWRERSGIPAGPKMSDVIPFAKKGDKEAPWYQPDQGGRWDLPMGDVAAEMALSPSGVRGILKTPRGIQNGIRGLMGKEALTRFSGMTAEEIKAKLTNEMQFARQHPNVGKAATLGRVIMDPMAELPRLGGRALYDSAFTEADQAAKAAGKPAVSDTMRRNSTWNSPSWGGSKALEMKAQEIRERLAARGGARIENLGADGLVPANPIRTAGMQDFEAMRTSKPGHISPARKAWTAVRQELDALRGRGKNLSVSEADSLARAYQEKARMMGAYREGGPMPKNAVKSANNALNAKELSDAYQATATAAREGVEGALDASKKGVGGQAFMDNRDIGSLMAGEKALKESANTPWMGHLRSASKTLVPGALAAAPAWYMGQPGLAAAALALGTGGAVLNTKLARTALGLGLEKASGLAGNTGRTAFSLRENKRARAGSPWSLMKQPNEDDTQ